MFRSRVTVLDPLRAQGVPAVIEMNRPIAYGGYRFFQSSYRMEGGREMSMLSVSRDPGQPMVFLGYGLLVAGMIVVFATRLVRQAAADGSLSGEGLRPAVADQRPARSKALAKTAAALAGLLLAAASLPAAQVPDAAVVARLRALPVQHDGRTMPFETQAREAVWQVTGLRAWPGVDPVAMVAGWSLDPGGWTRASRSSGWATASSALAIGLSPAMRYASYRTLAGERRRCGRSSSRPWRASRRRRSCRGSTSTPSRSTSGSTCSTSRSTAPRSVPFPAPTPTTPGRRCRQATPRRWPTSATGCAPARRRRTTRPRLPSSASSATTPPARHGSPGCLLLPAAVAAALTQARDRFRLRLVAGAGVLLGFAAMTWGLAVRWQIAGRIPASNMYESMLFLGWGVGLFGVVALAAAPADAGRSTPPAMARSPCCSPTCCRSTASSTRWRRCSPARPGSPSTCRSSWSSYSVLAMATVIAHLWSGAAIFAPGRAALVERWSQLLYWYLHVGSILLIAGILTGSIWAASSWGRYWGWDPKEVWSLVAFLAYMAILHARFDSQIGSFGVAACSIVAFWTILMTYLGVNFVLASGPALLRLRQLRTW